MSGIGKTIMTSTMTKFRIIPIGLSRWGIQYRRPDREVLVRESTLFRNAVYETVEHWSDLCWYSESQTFCTVGTYSFDRRGKRVSDWGSEKECENVIDTILSKEAAEEAARQAIAKRKRDNPPRGYP